MPPMNSRLLRPGGGGAPQTVPVIDDQPDNVSALAGETATFSVVAIASPSPTYQWQRSTDSGSTWANISGATSASYTTPTLDAGVGFGLTNNDGEQFRCVVTNAAGAVVSNAATLTVSIAPSIQMLDADVELNLDVSTTLEFSANSLVGYPSPSIDWQVSTDGGSTWASTGVTASNPDQGLYVVSFAGITDADRGNKYRAVLANRAGSFTSTVVTLLAYRIPAITAHPSGSTVNEGQTATLSVSATGTPAPTVQWQKSVNSGGTWANIAAATSTSYTTPTLATADDGNQYRAVFTNTAGSATTNAATLTIQDTSGVSYMWIAESFTPVYHWSN